MNPVDLVILIFCFLFFVWGFAKGIIRLFGWWCGVALAYYGIFFQAHNVQALLVQYINLSEIIIKIISYVLIVILAFVLVKILSLLIEKVFKSININWLNRLLGGLLLSVLALLIACSLLYFAFPMFTPHLQSLAKDAHAYRIACWQAQFTEPFLPQPSLPKMQLPEPQTQIQETIESFRGQIQNMVDKSAQRKQAIVDSLEQKYN